MGTLTRSRFTEFYPKMFALASEISGYKDWLTTGLAVTLQDFDERTSFTLAHSFFAYSRDMNPKEGPEPDAKRIAEIVQKIPPPLELDRFERLGLRCWFLYPVEMKFDQLVYVVGDKFLVQSKEIKEGICPSPTDVAYHVHFNDGDLKVKLRAGPIVRDELTCISSQTET
jgi:hypothetical protein